MTELRWNPTLREWVSTASHRQNRPLMPQDWCPFCPGSGRVPDNYDVYIYPNDFAAFSIPPEVPSTEGDGFYRVKPSHGKCDVVLYHPDHHTSLPELPIPHLGRLVGAWRKRFVELKETPGIRYVLIFENKGAVIGVTMPHPHGQIYALPLIPPLIKKELDSARAHFRTHHRCLFCDILEKERGDGRRVVAENRDFTAFVPFYARWPYEVHIYSRRHLDALDQLRPSEEKALAEILKWVTLKYDHLFQMSFPYMMLMHQAPTRGHYPYYHFHIEFYPPHRSKEKLKYLASVETGAGTFLNDSLAEEKAGELSATPPMTRREVAQSSRA
ncbi:MAG: galactose-1-phosphate uridylyltransferase [Acidobacteria bacterium]|nr:galactose-1-phosphate uridylyltransferase [Acidobacteriota bacterium]